MPRIVHFELAADDLDRAERFYGDLFGWSFNRWEGPDGFAYVMVNTGPEEQTGINGGLVRRGEAGAGTTIMLELVESIDDYTGKIEAAGGTITVPKFPVPGVGYGAYFTDTEGNRLGLFQSDESAA